MILVSKNKNRPGSNLNQICQLFFINFLELAPKEKTEGILNLDWKKIWIWFKYHIKKNIFICTKKKSSHPLINVNPFLHTHIKHKIWILKSRKFWIFCYYLFIWHNTSRFLVRFTCSNERWPPFLYSSRKRYVGKQGDFLQNISSGRCFITEICTKMTSLYRCRCFSFRKKENNLFMCVCMK